MSADKWQKNMLIIIHKSLFTINIINRKFVVAVKIYNHKCVLTF